MKNYWGVSSSVMEYHDETGELKTCDDYIRVIGKR